MLICGCALRDDWGTGGFGWGKRGKIVSMTTKLPCSEKSRFSYQGEFINNDIGVSCLQ